MTVDFAAIVDQLEADAGFRARLRAVVLSEELLELPERVAALDRHVAEIDGRLTGRLDALAEQLAAFAATTERRLEEVDRRFDAVDARFDAVDTRLDAVDRRFDAVDARFDAVDTRLDAVDRRFDAVDARFDAADRDRSRLHDDLGILKGRDFEEAVAAHPGRYLALVIDRPRARDLETFGRSSLTPEEDLRLLRADLVVAGQAKGSGGARELLATAEVSWRVHVDDLARALDRAGLLARVGGAPVLPVAVSKVDPGAAVVERAVELGVALVTDDGTAPSAPGRPVVA